MGQLLRMKLKNSPVPIWCLYPKEGSFKKSSRRFDSLLEFYEGEKWEKKKKSGLLTWSKNSELSKANPETLATS